MRRTPTSTTRALILAMLIGAAITGAACSQDAQDDAATATRGVLDKTKQAGDTVLDATKDGIDSTIDATKKSAATVIDSVDQAGDRAADATKKAAQQTADKTKEVAVAIGHKTKDVVSATGEVITDGWITTKVSAKFVDEAVLKDSNISVDTNDRVVTLKGTVPSGRAKTRAAAIAGGTEGVTGVVNQLVVNVT